MKRFYSSLLALAVLATAAAPAYAVLRSPQIAFNSASLQSRLNGFGESINVLTDQQNGLVWGSTVSSNSTMTIQFELAGNPHQNSIGVAALNATGNAVTALDQVFPPSGVSTGWFAVASFRTGGILIVNLFDPNAVLQGSVSYTGVNRALFAYYIKNAGGTFYSHEGFNADAKVHVMPFAGTGQNAGAWWLSWEDGTIATYAGADFDDALVFMESLNPTPVNHSTWGSLKQRFR
jgi:hypothetical protein